VECRTVAKYATKALVFSLILYTFTFHLVNLERFYEDGPALKTNFTKSENSEEFGFSKEEASRLFSHSLSKPASSRRGPVMLEFETEDDRIAYQRKLRESERAGERRLQRRRDEDLEEIAPKKEGHARQVERRHEKAAYTRSERNPNDFELDEKSLLGSGSDYEAALQRQRDIQAKRDGERRRRTVERDSDLEYKRQKHEEHEQRVQNMFKEMLKHRK